MIYGPKFKVLEVNDLVGLRNGHIIAQAPAAADITKKTYDEYQFIENGLILGLGKDGKLANYDPAKHAVPFLHYTEELITFGVALDRFAVEVPTEVGENAYPRAIALYIGDTFTTDNVVVGGVNKAECYAKVVNGVLTLEADETKDTMFRAVKTTMPAGGVGYEFTYYKNVKVTE